MYIYKLNMNEKLYIHTDNKILMELRSIYHISITID